MAVKAAGPRGAIARGLGASYGDAAMNAGGTVVCSTDVSGLLELDDAAGTARVLAGTSIDDLLRAIVPQGWFVPVTPGTKYVTIGGAIAADVHGKDHHATGSLGAHVRSMVLALPDGTRRTLTPHEHAEEFWATCGGMGLTGTIVEATIDLHPIETSLLERRQRPGARPRHAAGAAVRGRSPAPLLGGVGRPAGPRAVRSAARSSRRATSPPWPTCRPGACGAAAHCPTRRRPR